MNLEPTGDRSGMDTGAMKRATATFGAMVLAAAAFVGCEGCLSEPGASDRDTLVADGGPSDGGGGSDEDGGGDASECPLYQSTCGGECIPTQTDPDNCGACGNVCEDGEVCSSGSCTDSCQADLQQCGRECVDIESSNEHCGQCDNRCPDGEGCVGGECVDAVDVGDRADACSDGGPPVDLGETVTVERRCSGQLAERTFGWALCSCSEIDANGEVYADAYDSSLGPYTPGGIGGGIATNETVQANVGLTATGSLAAADVEDQGRAVNFNSAAQVGQRMLAGSNVRVNEGMTVDGDAHVDGDFGTGTETTIGGVLHVPDGADVDSNVSYSSIQRGPVDIDPPCDTCAPEDRIPVGELVEAHREDNDNDAIGLDPDAFDRELDDPRRLDLPCGHYYLSEIAGSREATIVAHGNTALYVGGDIRGNNQLTITVKPDAQLDVFVEGAIRTNEGMRIGSVHHPALLRMYIGGEEGFRTNSGAQIAGYLYAGRGEIGSNGESEIYGGVYAQTVSVNAGLEVHYDRHINVVGNPCPDDTTPDPDEDVCATEGDACSEDGDCCAPLTCNDEGTCELLQCQPLRAECSANEDCCSGTCGDGVCVGQ